MARGKETAERKTGVAGWNETEGASTKKPRPSAQSRQRKSVADRQRRVALLVALAVLCAACVWCFWPLGERIERGLWLKGGTRVTMSAAAEDGSKPADDVLRSCASTIRARIGAVGISECAVSAQDDGKIAIDLPWYVDAEAIAQSVGGTGLLEFVRSDDIGDADALAKLNAGTDGVELQKGTYTAFLDGSSVTSATVSEVASGIYAVTITFDDEGAKTFADITRELAESSGSIAIVVDGRIQAAPGVSEEITGGQVSISGTFTAQEANALKAVLDSGTLGAQLSYEGSEEIGPLVGKAGLFVLVGCACVAFVGVSVFAFVRYRKLALVVGGTMAVFGLTMLGLMALASRLDMFVLTIPGVVGGAVAAAATTAAAWLLVSHFHNKAVSGKTVRGASMSAVREGMRPLGIPCAITFVVSCVLLLVPFAAARDFGLAFIFGAVCGVVAVFWYGVTLLRLLAMGTIQAKPASWGVGADGAHYDATAKEVAA